MTLTRIPLIVSLSLTLLIMSDKQQQQQHRTRKKNTKELTLVRLCACASVWYNDECVQWRSAVGVRVACVCVYECAWHTRASIRDSYFFELYFSVTAAIRANRECRVVAVSK